MNFEKLQLRLFLGAFKALALFAFFGICAGNLHHLLTVAICLTTVLVLRAELAKQNIQ